jgi:hypothetical protein
MDTLAVSMRFKGLTAMYAKQRTYRSFGFRFGKAILILGMTAILSEKPDRDWRPGFFVSIPIVAG